MGSEMTLTAEEPALQVMMNGSAKMSVIISSQDFKLKVKNYWEKNKNQNEITLICRCLNKHLQFYYYVYFRSLIL